MSQITELSVMGVPGRVHSFSAKASAAIDTTSGIEFVADTIVPTFCAFENTPEFAADYLSPEFYTPEDDH